ncbi:MAG TPA: pantoate--beta-alanine ligase [Candidatus Binatia bacterium]|jgi:pantoate--beta-alanine ligase
MDTITDIRRMQQWADSARGRNQRIGFVPTMGYLHAGHLSLVREAQRHSDVTVASIFVNRLQFGTNEDLDRYPRDVERDTRLLAEAGTDILFLPEPAAMYPEGFQTTVTVERVTRGLCGASRPTHFTGVTTVVAKLFHIVKPHVAVFGRKDFQQLVAIRRMVTDLNLDIEIIGAPIVREPDGVAMSSRNAYLSTAERQAARCLSQALAMACALVERGESDGLRIVAAARQVIAGEPLTRLEYATLADPETLEGASAVRAPTLLALAVQLGKTRLIDNCILERSKAEG